MHARIIKALLLTASLAAALAAGCADMRDRFAAAGASMADDGTTAPRLRSPYLDGLPFGN
jgi:archaellum component FlaG (FlaF/FlaG flagellin family)